MKTHHSVLSLVAMGILISTSAGRAVAQQGGIAAPVATPQIQRFMQPDNGNFLRTSQVLGIPISHCGHVIDLMMKNRMREQLGTNGTEQLHMPHLTAGLRPGDLELLGVNLACDGDAHKGPVFQIGMKNNSNVPIGNFQVSVVGVHCQINVHSPTTTICIPRMEPCEEKLIQIQLPVTCMAMGPVGQQAAFDTLIVALDSCDQLMECDELNNVRILKRCDIVVAVAETPVAAQPTPGTPAPGAPAPGAPAPGAPAPPAPETPVEKESSPLDNLDLDNLQLENAQTLQHQI